MQRREDWTWSYYITVTPNHPKIFNPALQDDVQQRYVELVVKPKEQKTQHEFAITKASIARK